MNGINVNAQAGFVKKSCRAQGAEELLGTVLLVFKCDVSLQVGHAGSTVMTCFKITGERVLN